MGGEQRHTAAPVPSCAAPRRFERGGVTHSRRACTACFGRGRRMWCAREASRGRSPCPRPS
eukprot:3675183-Prymnesium_polylepis.1